MTNLQVEAADLRRAAALIVHYGRNNEDGVKAIIAETSDAKRPVPLILALLTLTDQVVPALYTDLGMSLLSAHILKLAGIEETDQ